MRSQKIIRGVAIAAILSSPLAMADDSGVYVGATVGQARQEFGEFAAQSGTFRLFGGWSFNEYFGIEGGYVDGGTLSDSLGEDGIDLDISSDGFFVEGLAKWPVSAVAAPYVKLGYIFYDSTTTLSIGNQRFSDSESDADFIFGGGIEFKIGPNFRLRAEYEKINLPDSAFDIMSIGGSWQF
jgi:OmpA-OmpF porin, OOP family